MQEQIQALESEATQALQGASSSREVEDLKVKYLGKKGPIQALMKQLRDCDPEERPQMGQAINSLKNQVATACDDRLRSLSSKELSARLETETLDVTLPGRRRYRGRRHILSQVMEEVVDILVGMGFSIEPGPHIDSDYYNFEALNFPPDHPARDMQDTFYVDQKFLLRTHMTNVQGHVMDHHKPPFRVVSPGKVFRNEAVSARSHVFFHQVDIFYVDQGVSFADLMATMEEFLTRFFGQRVKTRFRPSYFPFVEPGLEVDVACTLCSGSGCPICKQSGWLEIAGAGMMHPEVLKNGGIDPEEYSGYAWGMGLDRLVMLMRGIPDIRTFTENHLDFLRQFG